MPRRALLVVLALAASALLTACGTRADDVKGQSAAIENGSHLFAQRCAGCHTLEKAGALGSATKVKDRERVDGPNFDQRKECVPNVLYAIRNGGYSGAIMPENIVVGGEANDIAKFLEKYSGDQRRTPPGSTPVRCTAQSTP